RCAQSVYAYRYSDRFTCGCGLGSWQGRGRARTRQYRVDGRLKNHAAHIGVSQSGRNSEKCRADSGRRKGRDYSVRFSDQGRPGGKSRRDLAAVGLVGGGTWYLQRQRVQQEYLRDSALFAIAVHNEEQLPEP